MLYVNRITFLKFYAISCKFNKKRVEKMGLYFNFICTIIDNKSSKTCEVFKPLKSSTDINVLTFTGIDYQIRYISFFHSFLNCQRLQTWARTTGYSGPMTGRDNFAIWDAILCTETDAFAQINQTGILEPDRCPASKKVPKLLEILNSYCIIYFMVRLMINPHAPFCFTLYKI